MRSPLNHPVILGYRGTKYAYNLCLFKQEKQAKGGSLRQYTLQPPPPPL